MKFDIWMEGYSATGESGTAQLLGTVEGANFYDACVSALSDKLDTNAEGKYKLSIWACRLFDNEADARKSFG